MKKSIMLIYITNKEEKVMKKSALLFILPALILSSCGDTPVDPDPERSVNYTLGASLRKEGSTKTEGYNLSFKMKDSYFDSDANEFNKDIALLSNGKSMMVEKESTMREFYSAFGFDKVSAHYPEHTENTIQYALAHKKIGNYDLVSVAINGHSYGLEWKNNALLGLEGDHEGFSARANDIYADLKTYVAGYENIKLWISGYSRGGAIANVLSHYIIHKEEIDVLKRDMFVYTFECPKGLDDDNAPEYSNVFNVLYSGDLVTYLSPEEYGFARCGTDIDLYQSSLHTDEVLYEFDEDIAIPAFERCIDYNDNSLYDETEQEQLESLMKYITRDGEDTSTAAFVHTREDYVNKEQRATQTALSIFFGLPDDIKDELVAAAKEKGASLLNSAQEIYDLITPFLDEAHYEYDPDELMADCEALYKLIINNAMLIVAIYMQNANAKDIMRSIDVHYPEVGYALLMDYEPVENLKS